MSAPAPSTVNPFAPEGVEFQPVSARQATARLIVSMPVNALLAIGLAVAAVLHSPWWWLGVAAVLALSAWELWLVPRQVRAMGYALGEDHLLWRKGIMFREMNVIPYGRMQFVDTSQGPLARHFGMAEVKLHTAAATTDATINGLPTAEAEHLRRILSERGEQRMAGL